MSAELTPITFVQPSPHGDALPVRALLADAAEALAAYDRHAAVLLGEPYEPRRIVWAEPGGAVETPLAVVGVELGAADEPGASEEPGKLGEEARTRRSEPRHKAAERLIPAGTLVYGVFATRAGAATAGRSLPHKPFGELEAACERNGARWSGGLLVNYGHLRCEHVTELPRMGILRRPISEATDQLIAALRSSLTLPEAAQTFGYEGELAEQAAQGVLEASQPLPKPLCTLIAALR